jgi:hypothetical protein
MTTVASSPPGTRVEEDLDLDLPSDFSESKMFTVPDNWDPPTSFVVPAALSRPTRLPGSSAAPNDEYTTCMVEEDPPSSYIGLQASTEGPEVKETNKDVKETNKEPEVPASPSPLHLEILQLIFEVHSLVDDQLFRAVCVSQHLDMLYVAYSNATPRQQCPTCSQPFAIPASSGKTQEAHKDTRD